MRKREGRVHRDEKNTEEKYKVRQEMCVERDRGKEIDKQLKRGLHQ